MEERSRLLIAVLTLVLIISSIVMPSVLFFKYSGFIEPEQGYATGTIELTVIEDETTPPPGGGGGGGGGAITTHLLDFTIQEEYTIYPERRDKIKAIFEGGFEYNFEVTIYEPSKRMNLLYITENYLISFGEVVYFDLNSDGKNDMSIYLLQDGGSKFTALFEPGPPEQVLPIVTREDIRFPTIPFPGGIRISIMFLLVLLALAILTVFVYHQLKLRRIEKTHKTKINKMYSVYRKKKKTKEVKQKMRGKLEKQLDLLNKAYDSGYVSKDSYLKGKKKINNMIRSIKR